MVTKTVTTSFLSTDDCRHALTSFWSEQLAVEATKTGIVMALPLMLPDGVQITVEVQSISERSAILTDAGETLRWLAGRGINLKADTHKQWIEERIAVFELSRSGFELFREITLPIQGIDVHLFGEALVSIAHLICRHETQQPVVDNADTQIQRIFSDLHLDFQQNVSLAGHIEETVQVDYYFEHHSPSAMEVVRKGGSIIETMERWGYRWQDLKRKNPQLRSAMLYDPDRQTIDATSRRIGEEVCDLFCGYHESDRIQEFVNA